MLQDSSHTGARSRNRALSSVRCMGRIGLRVESGYLSDVMVSMRLSFRVIVKHG